MMGVKEFAFPLRYFFALPLRFQGMIVMTFHRNIYCFSAACFKYMPGVCIYMHRHISTYIAHLQWRCLVAVYDFGVVGIK